jgi:hypothetical protein
MANKKITELPDIGTPASGDLLEIVDISEGVSKRVAVSALGGGSTPTLQDVRDENPNVTVENPDDENNTALWQSPQYNEDDLAVVERLIINGVGAELEQSTTRVQDSAVIVLQGSEFDTSTEDSSYSSIGVTRGKIGIGQRIDDSTLNEGSHSLQLDPVVGVNVVFKTASDETAGTKLLATREWVNSNLPTIDATPTDGSSNAVSSNGVFDALALKSNKPLVDTVSSSALTGVTTEGILKSYLIPANTLTSSEILNFSNDLYKTGTAGTVTSRLYTNTSASLSGANLLAVNISTVGSRKISLRRQLVLKGGNIETLATTATVPDDNVNSGTVATIVTFNPTVDNYFITTAQNASTADSTIQNNLKIYY